LIKTGGLLKIMRELQMLSSTEAWTQQTRQSCLDVCSAYDNPLFLTFAERALRALLADELRRYTPHSLSACVGFLAVCHR
jgi:glutamate dehydrogenase